MNVSDIYVVNNAFFYILRNVLRLNGDTAEEVFTSKILHHLKTNFKRIDVKAQCSPSREGGPEAWWLQTTPCGDSNPWHRKITN